MKRKKSKKYATGAKGFLQWLKTNQPKVFAAAKESRAATLSGFGEVSLNLQTATTAPASSNWASTVKDVLLVASQAYLTKEQVKAQSKLLDTQLKRAQAGLAPLDIDMEQFGVPRAQVGLDSSTRNMLLFGGIGLGLLLLFRRRA